MSERDPNSIEPAATDELLVAYLDGELDAAQRHAVEMQLLHDDAFRHRLRDLEKAWDLLDELPQTVADEKFVRSTVEMVALAAESEAETRQRQSAWPRRASYAAVGAMTLFAAILGYRAVNQYVERDDRALARDLPVIEDLDLYRRIDNVDFLRQLHDEGLFDKEDTNAP